MTDQGQPDWETLKKKELLILYVDEKELPDQIVSGFIVYLQLIQFPSM